MFMTWLMFGLLIMLLASMVVGFIYALLMKQAGAALNSGIKSLEWYEREYGGMRGSSALKGDVIAGEKLERLLRDKPELLVLLQQYREKLAGFAFMVALSIGLFVLMAILGQRFGG
jgi:hypothetical protein